MIPDRQASRSYLSFRSAAAARHPYQPPYDRRRRSPPLVPPLSRASSPSLRPRFHSQGPHRPHPSLLSAWIHSPCSRNPNAPSPPDFPPPRPLPPATSTATTFCASHSHQSGNSSTAPRVPLNHLHPRRPRPPRRPHLRFRSRSLVGRAASCDVVRGQLLASRCRPSARRWRAGALVARGGRRRTVLRACGSRIPDGSSDPRTCLLVFLGRRSCVNVSPVHPGLEGFVLAMQSSNNPSCDNRQAGNARRTYGRLTLVSTPPRQPHDASAEYAP